MPRVKPRIVLTLSRPTERNRSFIARYRPALERAGAEVVEVYPGDPVPDDFDGLLLAGGGDIDPSRYGSENEGSVGIDEVRDEQELALARLAIERDLPVLGICRGLQILNVAHGGSLVQHIETHRAPPDNREHRVVHELTPLPGSRVAASTDGEPLKVNSHHHQAVTEETLGRGLEASATADGVVEALEASNHRWLVGVQWHPEQTHEVSPNATRIFDAFVAEAASTRVATAER
jgi:putative glutamine amidotransferase